MSALMEQGIRQLDAGLACIVEAAKSEEGISTDQVRGVASTLHHTAGELEALADATEGKA